jgi:TonB-linked SusC/RagA family outer membrane protein
MLLLSLKYGILVHFHIKTLNSMKRLLSILIFSFLCLATTVAQQRTITGTVTDTDGEALIGTTVLVKGTSIGTVTDIDGKFSLEVTGNPTLVFSYTGFAAQEIKVGTSNVIDVTLESSSVAFEEVVVLGYSTRSRNEVTGSAVQLSSEKISQLPLASVDQALQGNVAGLQLSGTSGTPGSVQTILIRGRSSITASTDPLFVIDGVPVNNGNLSRSGASSSFNPLATLNPENIESITVLKDPASTAPYGARGTNGVIVITTKSGRAGTPSFNFSTTYGFQNDATRGPEMLTAAQAEELFYEAIFNTYGESNGFTRAEAEQFYLDNTSFFGSKYQEWNEDGRPETVWQDVITNEDAPVQSYDLSVNGGNDQTNYFASLGYFHSEATVIGSDFERISGALNLTTKLNDKLSFTTRNNLSYSEQDGLLENSAYFSGPRTVKYFLTPVARPYNDDGSLNLTNLYSNVRNPLWIADNDISLSRVTRLTSNNALHWDTPIKNLSFDTKVSIDFQSNNWKRYQNRVHGDAQDVAGYAQVDYIGRTNTVIQNSLSYNISANRHNVDFRVLQEYQSNKSNLVEAGGENFSADGLTNVASAGTPTYAWSSYTDWYIGSYLGLVNYSFDGRYVLNASIRREGSSRFPSDSRWGTFWSAGVAWNISEELFMAGADFISNLKLRSSFGVTGNAGIGLNTYQASLSFSSAYGGEAGITPASLGNANLQWERAESFEIGADFGFFDNRITGLFNYYSRKTVDMLQSVPLSRTTGFSSQNQNVGEMVNNGIELELDFAIIQSQDFNLSIGGNLGTNQNEVLELAKDGNGNEIKITTGSRRTEVGRPVYEWYMVGYAGVDPETGDALYYTNDSETATTTNFGAAQRYFQGTTGIPTIIAGINFHVDFKGVFLDAQGNYTAGHQVYMPWTRYIYGSDRWSYDLFAGANVLMNRWQQPGDVTDVPKLTYTLQPWRTFSRFLRDGDFFRLRNVTLGYNFDPGLVERIGLGSARVFVRGINLYTWAKDDTLEWDPEFQYDGFNELTTPPVKSVVFGLNVTF